MPTPPLDAAVLRASIDAVNRNGGNVAAAARELGISRTTLQSRVVNAVQPSTTTTLDPSPYSEHASKTSNARSPSNAVRN